MKLQVFNQTFVTIAAGTLLLAGFSACERSVDGLDAPDVPINPNVFIDGFSGGLNYAAFGSSVPTAFQVDEDVTYNNSTMSMRFDVPDANDPRGTYAGGSFFTGAPRDLSQFDALTFWAKATASQTLDIVGMGNDLGANRYLASVSGLNLTTSWKKYIIPLPDPSLLTAEKGMFFYSTGPVDGKGYTFWIDELKFEKLGTVAHPVPAILNGNDETGTLFTGVTRPISGLQTSFNMPDGTDLAVGVSTAYFKFQSSDTLIAKVDATGTVTAGINGTAVITGTLSGVPAGGSLTITSRGVFPHAPTPSHTADNVISLFSNSFTNRPVDYYNGFWAPFQTTQSADFEVLGDDVLNYTNFNFVGIQFSAPTIDATAMTHFHVDIYLPNALASGTQFKIQLVDFGADGVFAGSDNSSHTLTFTAPTLVSQSWVSFDIPFSSFTNLRARAHLAQVIFEGTNLTNFYADNIYFRK